MLCKRKSIGVCSAKQEYVWKLFMFFRCSCCISLLLSLRSTPTSRKRYVKCWMSITNRFGEEVDGRNYGQRQQPDSSGHRQRQLRCPVDCRRQRVTDCCIAISTEYCQSKDCSEPVESCRRVEQLADYLAEYPLLHTCNFVGNLLKTLNQFVCLTLLAVGRNSAIVWPCN